MSIPTFHALIAAAGRPRRCGAFQVSDPLGSLSVIRRIIHTFRQAGAEEIVVITGYQARELERHLARSGVICLRNEDWDHTDMMASVRLGLSYLAPSCGPVLFTPADIPLFTVSTVLHLLESNAKFAVPHVNGKNGHPLFLGTEIQPFLLNFKEEGGLRKALRCSQFERTLVEVMDEGVLFDAELSTDCEELLERHRRQPFLPLINVSLERESLFFDKTTAMLLRLISQTGSVKKACGLMGLSYSKGWVILNDLELQAGITAIRRRPGGSDGGATTLTVDGEAFLERFSAYESEVTAMARACFDKYFHDKTVTNKSITSQKEN